MNGSLGGASGQEVSATTEDCQFRNPPRPLSPSSALAEAVERAERAEAEVVRLRQQLLTFSDKLALVARDQVTGAPATPAVADLVVAPAAAGPPPSVPALTVPVQPIDMIAPLGSTGCTPMVAPAIADQLTDSRGAESRGAGGGASDDGGAGSTSADGRAAKRSRRVWTFNAKWKTGREWLEYNGQT